MVVGLFLVLAVRPDPKRIAELLAGDRAKTGEPRTPAAPLRELVRRPGVIPSLLAAVASFSVMVSVMTLTGYVVVEEHGHPGHTVFPIIAAHVVGMYALVLVVGDVIDRIGRIPALVGGLLLMAVAVISLLWIAAVWATALALFTLGLGWNFSFVAATAQLADRTAPHERGKLLGFADLLSGLTGAGLALLGGYALSALGVAALAIGATLVVLAPAAWISRSGAGFREATPATIVSRRTPSSAAFVMKTWNAKTDEIERRWYVVDAEGQTLGRLATRIADTLRGKRKPEYTPHVDTGDFVVVVNAEKVAVTGKKREDKIYYRHSGYPGGLRERTLGEELERRPTEVLRKAVKGMLPRNRLARQQINKLKIYAGPEHPHVAQNPQNLPDA
jgi:large subunit ribosomal protein L13